MPFKQLGISAELLEGINAMGYTDPTPIQLRAIPLILEGRDVIGSAQTGTGKTAAFALPILTRLQPGAKTPRALVVVPTRELAAQMETAFRDFARFTDFRIGLVYGGVGYGKQLEMLNTGVDVLVATPGRLLDLIQQRHCSLATVEYAVLDEADRMLDMGFIHDIRRIMALLPKKRQSLFFSATISREIQRLSEELLSNPVSVAIAPKEPTVDRIAQKVFFVDNKKNIGTQITRKVHRNTRIHFLALS